MKEVYGSVTRKGLKSYIFTDKNSLELQYLDTQVIYYSASFCISTGNIEHIFERCALSENGLPNPIKK